MTPKGPASVTLLPRLDHMAMGAQTSERTERGGVETSVGGEKKDLRCKKERKKQRKCDKDTEDGKIKEKERQMDQRE